MKKPTRPRRSPRRAGPDLFATTRSKLRRSLVLPHLLDEEAQTALYRGERQDRARTVLERWADLETGGHLQRKETALDADFLREVFGEGLGFASATLSPDRYNLERNFAIPGVGVADGAIGLFEPGSTPSPIAVIELKGAAADLDRDRFNGRTPVQQCWDYLNALPACPWGIVSNFVTIRLYHRDKTPLAYEEFRLDGLGDPDEFRRFFCLFEHDGLLTSAVGQPPRALQLLERSDTRRFEVGDRLYRIYSDHRLRLIRHLSGRHGKGADAAIRIAQKLLDRIVFIAFCEQRGLLPDKSLDLAYTTLPPFTKVTNPRWRNFLDLFRAIDLGHDRLDLKTGYNGGLFRHDPEVDDLQLDDEWTGFFRDVGDYDFRDEVNVDVLGHLFEKSIGELEQIRAAGLIVDGEPDRAGATGAMPKSAGRKRSGTYYTPPDFTRLIVREVLHVAIERRREAIRLRHGLAPAELLVDQPSPALAAFWSDCWDDLRAIKLCDPACGSGAFLIRAYDTFEEEYVRVADQLRLHRGPGADALIDDVAGLILGDNLHGVDLSEQAVEITQLALWLRSARRGKTLADLSHNIVCGNSLVADAAVPGALDWRASFPSAFDRPEPGFDCVVGNPPWERLKLQEREFFSATAPAIAEAVSAAKRRALIAELESANPELHAAYLAARAAADSMLDYARRSGRFPLTGQGDINTYMLFAELARSIVAPHGRVGLLVPSGIATDNTTKEFFGQLVSAGELIALYDFENNRKVFPDVDGRFKFSVLLFGGGQARSPQADFVFFAHRTEDLLDRHRHIALSAKDLALLNPNTRTCPIFRSRRDAELTKAIYRRVPILWDENRIEGGNPWGIKYVTIFHQTNDAELFLDPAALAKLGCRLEGNRWIAGARSFLPLYEAKMVQAYDHRAASVVLAEKNWTRQGQTEETSLVEHQNPEFVAQPRWWVDEAEFDRRLGARRPAYLAYKDVTSATNQRTVIAAFLPRVAAVNSAPLMVTGESIGPRLACCLLANLNALVLDYVARQKVGGNHLNYFIVNQLPIVPPDRYAQRCPWDRRQSLERWISDRVLKLTCTSNDMIELAESAGLSPPVHKWEPAERAELIAELDAAYFLLYGVARDDAAYVIGTFRGHADPAPRLPNSPDPASLLLRAYDRLSG